MPTSLDQKGAADALWNGLGPMTSPATPIPPVPPQGPSNAEMDAIFEQHVRPKLDKINKGMPYELGGGAYNDSPTAQQDARDLEQRIDKAFTHMLPDPSILPPPELPGDNPTKIISPDKLTDETFHPADYMPLSYGAGKYKIYTPAMGDLMNTMRPPLPPPSQDVIQKLLDALKGKK